MNSKNGCANNSLPPHFTSTEPGTQNEGNQKEIEWNFSQHKIKIRNEKEKKNESQGTKLKGGHLPTGPGASYSANTSRDRPCAECDPTRSGEREN